MSINFSVKKVKSEDFEKENTHLARVAKNLEKKIKSIKPKYKNPSKTEISLTKRELEVLKLISEGKNNSEISDELFITLATAKAHVSNIIHKLNASDRTEAGYIAKQKGII